MKLCEALIAIPDLQRYGKGCGRDADVKITMNDGRVYFLCNEHCAEFWMEEDADSGIEENYEE